MIAPVPGIQCRRMWINGLYHSPGRGDEIYKPPQKAVCGCIYQTGTESTMPDWTKSPRHPYYNNLQSEKNNNQLCYRQVHVYIYFSKYES